MFAATMEYVENPGATNVKAGVNLPEWIGLELAGKLLAVSTLHVRVLARNGVLDNRTTAGHVEVKTSDVLAYRPKAHAAQEDFVSDVACSENLRNRVISMCV